MPARFLKAAPYQKDVMALPVADIDSAIPYYVEKMGFQVVGRSEAPFRSVVLARDAIQIGLQQNGGDPTQDGAWFQVDDITAAFEELKGRGAAPGVTDTQTFDGKQFRVFFVVAPDGLCYMLACGVE